MTVHGGLSAALERGRHARDEWVQSGVVVDGRAFAAARGVPQRALSAAVQRGDLFYVAVRRRHYYVANLLDVAPEQAAAVCQALQPLSGTAMAFFWLRKHGAMGDRTSVEGIRDHGLDRVVQLALATSAQARAAQRGAGGKKSKTKSILDMAGMLQAPEGTHVPIEDMNPWR